MNYLLGSEKDFHGFVNSISKEDKIGIVTHTDLDGIASGIFLQKILESKDLKIEFIEFLDYSSDALQKVSEKDYDKLFLTDWSADNFQEGLEELRKKGDVLVFDHHPLNKDLENKKGIIKTESKYCSAHALFDLAKNYFNTKDWEWLVCSAIILDYCFIEEKNFNFIKSIYPEIDKEDVWSSEPGKMGKRIANALIFYKKNKKEVYDLVLEKKVDLLGDASKIISNEIVFWVDKFKEEAEYFFEKKLYFYYATPKYGMASAVVSIVSQQEFPMSTSIFVYDDKNREGFIKMSARNQTGNVKLGEVLKKCVEGFEDSNAGGHDRAAAGGFPKKYLEEFKERLLKEL
jgi:single-stranded DNA-specific DHH superfamily exonuclease